MQLRCSPEICQFADSEVVYQDIRTLHVTVHDALGMAVVERLEDLKHVVANIKVIEALVQFTEVSVTCVDELGDDGWCLRQWISYNVDQLNNINTMLQSLQNLDFSSDLVFLH